MGDSRNARYYSVRRIISIELNHQVLPFALIHEPFRQGVVVGDKHRVVADGVEITQNPKGFMQPLFIGGPFCQLIQNDQTFRTG